jgi:hypothetical protein
VGPLRLPLSARRARSLREVARPARFGQGSRTLLDRGVRDTWEIARSRVKIDQRRWQRTLEPRLEAIRDDLGLSPEVRLRARLYKLLVYEPGQFFRVHQDSERDDDMVGTLAVVLPSHYRGGSEIIELHGNKVRYARTRSGDRELTFIAFYADCHHEVKPVTDGYRVVLVYQLLASGARAAPGAPAAAVDALAGALTAHFATPTRTHGRLPAQPPEKLVYLLDHQYSQRSLGWHRLKGSDSARAAALRDAAVRAGCEVHLGLADIHESWDCIGDGPGSGGWGRRGWYADEEDDEDEDDAGQPANVELTDLIDSDVQLRHLIDAGGKAKRIASLGVYEPELCFTRANDDLEPLRSEYEPYTGNAGSTMERWYHRAAVVIWPRSLDFSLRGRADPSWALSELGRMLRKHGPGPARDAARTLVRAWPRAVREAKSRRLIARAMKLAAALGDGDLAASLLGPFRLPDLDIDCVAPLAQLCAVCGGERVQAILARQDADAWHDRDERDGSWETRLAALCEAIRDEGSPAMQAIASWLPAHEWELTRAMGVRVLADADRPVAGEELRAIGIWLVHIVDAAVAADEPVLRDTIVRFLISPQQDFPVDALLGTLRAARERIAPSRLARLGLAPLAEHVTETLQAAVSEPERSPDDWSIRAPMRCACELCATLRGFLSSPHQRQFEWPLAEDRRLHVQHQIDVYALPVDHVTRRKGRPYTLVLSKRKELFAREQRMRRQWRQDLAWVGRQRRHFG